MIQPPALQPRSPELVFRGLADPTRRMLFERLCQSGTMTVGALTSTAGVSQPAVSRHLAVLRQAGLVRAEPSGRETRYTACPDALAPMLDWTREMAGFWHPRLDALADLLKRMDQ